MKPLILTVMRDVGGANAVLPVVKKLAELQHVAITTIADKHAIPIVASADIEYRRPEHYGRSSNLADLAHRIIDREHPTLILTGTSMASSVERHVIRAARPTGIPTLAVLDHWSNYAERFRDEINHHDLAYLPDTLCVMDPMARAECLAVGIPDSTIRVTGQPFFDDLGGLGRSLNREAIRQRLQVSPDTLLVVFASEPQAHDYGSGPDDSRYLGYTEDQALALFIEGILQAKLPQIQPTQLVVKLHPRETDDRLKGIINSYDLPSTILAQFPARELMVASDIVSGMTSMFLIEAALLGKTPISVQPGRRDSDQFAGTRMGFCEPVYNLKECTAVLRRIRGSDQQVGKRLQRTSKGVRLVGCASDVIVNLIMNIVKTK